MTSKDLDDLEHRLAKGWVIRPDQIRTLIAVARNWLSEREGSKTASAAQQTLYPGFIRP